MIYCKKTYNKCKIHNKQLVDQNDPRSKEKGNTLMITDPNDPEKRKRYQFLIVDVIMKI